MLYVYLTCVLNKGNESTCFGKKMKLNSKKRFVIVYKIRKVSAGKTRENAIDFFSAISAGEKRSSSYDCDFFTTMLIVLDALVSKVYLITNE